MTTIGHNGGPTMEAGASWRRHSWKKAREALLPTLPIEVVRLRVKRAAEIGLDYRTYASIRAASGHDVIALLFSTNALRMLAPAPSLPTDRHAKLAAVTGTARAALVNTPLHPATVLTIAGGTLDHASPAPRPFANWSQARAALAEALRPGKWPADRVVLIGDTAEEREWAQAGRLAFYLPADRYFAA
jgi:hypothetical protein